MKHSTGWLLAMAACVVAGSLILSSTAHAEGDVVCVITVNTASASLTTQADGGSSCSWVNGATVAVECPNAKVCYKPDGGAAVATRDLCMNFLTASGNPDPYLISLASSQKTFSMIAAEIGDGGTTTNCKLGLTTRRLAQ